MLFMNFAREYPMNRVKKPFSGACTALITPFGEDGEVARAALWSLLERQIRMGIDAVLVLGTTGEASVLTENERDELISLAAECVAERVPLLVGAGSNSTDVTVKRVKSAAHRGADAVLLVTPYYNKTTPAGLVRHYTVCADASPCPVILYNVPSRTGIDIPLSAYRALASHPNIVGVKEASGNIDRVADLCAEFGEDFGVWAGNDGEAVPVLSLGGRGVISVVSNLFPRAVVRMCRAMEEGRGEEAASIQLRLLPLIRALFSEVNPIPVKAAAKMLGLSGDTVRLPLVPMDGEKRKELQIRLCAFSQAFGEDEP